MKVALVTEWLDAWRGGAETSTLQFTHHLMDRGVELHVFTRSRPSPAPGLHIHTISGAAMSRTRRSVTFARRVDHQIRREAFDVVHAISPCREATIYQPRGGTVLETIERNLALIRRRTARRAKKYLNRLNFKQRYQRSIERVLLGREEGPVVIAISDYVVRQLKKHYDLPDRRIRKIFNGVDPDPAPPDKRSEQRRTMRREFGVAEEDFLVLLVSHNFRLKGVLRWMEALSILRKRGTDHIRSLVVGKGDTRRWHRLARRLGISNRITFTGPTQRVRAFYHAADLLVHPTYYDPCSRVVLEAMVSGLPCITTRWDGSAEIIEHGRNGFILHDPDDVNQLADQVDQLARDASLEKIATAAARIRDSVTMRRHTDSMLELYRELVSRRTSPDHAPAGVH